MNKTKLFLFIFIYSLSSLIFFTLFMGVPIFNILIGALGANYLIKNNIKESSNLLYYRIFSLCILLITFFASAILALSDSYTAANLEGMLHLKFEVTSLHIWLLIIVGGSLFLYLNDLFIRIVLKHNIKTTSDN